MDDISLTNAKCQKVGRTDGVVSRVTSRLVNKFFRAWRHNSYGFIVKVYAFTFLLILPILCHRLPNSVYFMRSLLPSAEETLHREINENERLTHEAWDYMKQQGIGGDYRKSIDGIGSQKQDVQIPSNRTVFITVISINRRKVHGYLTRTVAKLHKLIKKFQAEFGLNDYFTVALCNVDTWPIDNRELYRVSTALDLPVFERYAIPVREITDNPFGKEKDDYAFCLHQSLKNAPKFVLLLEDDAVLVDNALWVIKNVVSYSYHQYSEHDRNQIAFFKLFHPSRLLSFISIELERIPQLLALGAVFGTPTFWIYKSTFARVKVSVWMMMMCYFVLLFFCIGRPYLLKLCNLSSWLYEIVPAPYCCTPAMLFPSENGKLLADYLRDTEWRAHPKDKVIKMFLKDTGLKGRMVVPNLVDHIGIYSTLSFEFGNPYYSN